MDGNYRGGRKRWKDRVKGIFVQLDFVRGVNKHKVNWLSTNIGRRKFILRFLEKVKVWPVRKTFFGYLL